MSTRLSGLDFRDNGRTSLDVELGELPDEAPEEDAGAVLHRLCMSGVAEDMNDFLAEMSEDDLDEQDLDEGLAIASHHGHAECVELLLKCGASAKWSAPDGGTTPLHVASQSGSAACVNLLLEAGAEVDAADSLSGATATYVAACNGKAECIELLLAANATPDLAYDGGVTPLHAASQFGHADCVAALIEARASLDAMDEEEAAVHHYLGVP